MSDSVDDKLTIAAIKMLPANLGLRLKPPVIKKKKVLSTTREKETSESRQYFKHEKWWLRHSIPEAERCTVQNCTYEPIPHPTHCKAKKWLSFVEKKIIVKFLINKHLIKDAKGEKVYRLMIDQGYLKHRSVEALRNCLRRTILFEIQNYNLEQLHLKQFQQLRDK